MSQTGIISAREKAIVSVVTFRLVDEGNDCFDVFIRWNSAQMTFCFQKLVTLMLNNLSVVAVNGYKDFILDVFLLLF